MTQVGICRLCNLEIERSELGAWMTVTGRMWCSNAGAAVNAPHEPIPTAEERAWPRAGRVRHMTCCVCGNYAGRWAQHSNRDDEYGICASCVVEQHALVGDAEFRNLYGVPGVNCSVLPSTPMEGS